MFEKPNICKECKGKCCKNMPGIYSPDDFKDFRFQSILELFKTTDYVINSWMSAIDPLNVDPSAVEYTYYIRPRARKDRFHDEDAWFDCICAHLTPTGCALESNERPLECRSVEPATKECIQHTKKETIIDEWKKPYYQKVLNEVMEYINKAEGFDHLNYSKLPDHLNPIDIQITL